LALSHWAKVQGMLTVNRAAVVETRQPFPLATVTAPVAGAMRKVVVPLVAETTLFTFAVAIDAVCPCAVVAMQPAEIAAMKASIGCRRVEDGDIAPP
jgi:hypothetical protein